MYKLFTGIGSAVERNLAVLCCQILHICCRPYLMPFICAGYIRKTKSLSRCPLCKTYHHEPIEHKHAKICYGVLWRIEIMLFNLSEFLEGPSKALVLSFSFYLLCAWQNSQFLQCINKQTTTNINKW